MKLLATSFLLLCASRLLAQSYHSPFQFGICPPLSTNGTKAKFYTNEASVNLLIGISKNENNFTLAGFSNIIRNNATGVQLATVSNHIGNRGNGVSIAGVMNIANFYQGVQLATVFNKANNFRGVQFAGLFNVAKTVKGVQFATLLNIADDNDFPIALLNLIKHGEKGVAATYDVLGNTIVSFRSGGKYTYGILGIGFNHKTQEDNSIVITEAGYGVHIPLCKWLQLNNEIKATTIGASSDSPSINLSYLLGPSIEFKKHYNIFGGISVNYFTSKSADAENLLPDSHLWEKQENDRLQRLYLGFQAGIQYIF